jgi:RNA-directed DNA polymerase
MYHTFTIPKKSGGVRTITAPDKATKAAQKAILLKLYKSKPASNLCHGFTPGRSPMTNALKHVGKRYVANMDIRDFFPNCRKHMLPDDIDVDVDVVFHERALPQGSPASPHLANLYLKKFDCKAVSVLRENLSDDIVYTRYADDITISSNSKAIEKASEIINGMLASEGFTLHPDKTHLAGPGQCKNITGLNINSGRPTVPKKYRRKVRAMVHRASKGWLVTESQGKSLTGMIAYIGSCHPEEAAKYTKILMDVQSVKKAPARLVGKKAVKLNAKGKFKQPKSKANGESAPTISRRIKI